MKVSHIQKKSGWTAFAPFKGHPSEVIPNNDLKEHYGYEECWCHPFKDGDVLVHNAADGRTRYE